MTVTSSLSAAVGYSQSSALDLGTANLPVSVRQAVQFASGTGAGMADVAFQDRRTLAASASEDLDLAGSLVGPFGATLTFAKVKGLYLKAADTNTNNVVFGAAGSNAWATLLNSTGTITLRPGATALFFVGQAEASGYTVTPATGDLLHALNGGSGTPVTYDVVVIGTSA